MPAIGRLGSPRYGYKGFAHPMGMTGMMREKFFANWEITRFQQIAGRAGIVGGMLHVAGLQRWVFNMKRGMYYIENTILIALQRATGMFGKEMQRLLDTKLQSSRWSRGKGPGTLRSSIRWGLTEIRLGEAVGEAWVDEKIAPHARHYIKGEYPVSHFTPRSGKDYIIVPIRPKISHGGGGGSLLMATSEGGAYFRTHKVGKAWNKRHMGYDFVSEAYANKWAQARRLVNSAIRGTMAGMRLGQKGSGRAFLGIPSGGKMPGRRGWPRAEISHSETGLRVS